MTELEPMRLHHHRESEPEHLLQRAQHLQAGPGLGYECADFLTDIAAYLAAQQGPEIKGLEWHGPDWCDEYTARSMLGVFVIGHEKKDGTRWCMGGYHATLDEAKAAAQADYETRIRSALVAEPTPRCFICDQPLLEGQLVLQDVSDGLGHRACFGDDREGFVKDIDTGEALDPDAPLPTGFPYEPPPMEGMDGTRVVLIDREDGGLRVWSPDLPGLILSGADPAGVASAIPAAIKGLREYAATPNHPEPGADHDRD